MEALLHVVCSACVPELLSCSVLLLNQHKAATVLISVCVRACARACVRGRQGHVATLNTTAVSGSERSAFARVVGPHEAVWPLH